MSLPRDRARQLPWLRLHLFMSCDVLAGPWGREEWLIVTRELARCAEWQRAMIGAGWFN